MSKLTVDLARFAGKVDAATAAFAATDQTLAARVHMLETVMLAQNEIIGELALVVKLQEADLLSKRRHTLIQRRTTLGHGNIDSDRLDESR